MRHLLIVLLLMTLPISSLVSTPDSFPVCTKEDLSLLPTVQENPDLSGLYNITPPAVLEATDWRLFKEAASCSTLLLADGELRVLGNSFGGWGVTSAVPCDADGDGKQELLFTYSWGSGIHRSILSLYDPETAKESSLAVWYEWETDLVVLPPVAGGDLGPIFPVCLAEVNIANGNYADLNLRVTTSVGYVTLAEGGRFVPIVSPESLQTVDEN